MNAADDAVRRILADGASRCSDPLKKISQSDWSIEEISTDAEAAGALERMMDESVDAAYGSWFTVPGAAFLIVIPRACGLRLTDRFTKEHAEIVDTLERREIVALAEIANILVNAFVTSLAQALDEDLIVSAPTPMLESSRDLLASTLGRRPEPGIAGLVRLSSAALSASLSIVALLEPATAQRLTLR